MKTLSVVALAALLMGSIGHAYAQMPNINLLADGPSKTPEEREAEEARDKAYKETLRKIPNAQSASDPWGNMRSADAPKTPAVKTTAAKKPKSAPNPN